MLWITLPLAIGVKTADIVEVAVTERKLNCPMSYLLGLVPFDGSEVGPRQ